MEEEERRARASSPCAWRRGWRVLSRALAAGGFGARGRPDLRRAVAWISIAGRRRSRRRRAGVCRVRGGWGGQQRRQRRCVPGRGRRRTTTTDEGLLSQGLPSPLPLPPQTGEGIRSVPILCPADGPRATRPDPFRSLPPQTGAADQIRSRFPSPRPRGRVRERASLASRNARESSARAQPRAGGIPPSPPGPPPDIVPPGAVHSDSDSDVRSRSFSRTASRRRSSSAC